MNALKFMKRFISLTGKSDTVDVFVTAFLMADFQLAETADT